MPFVIRCAELSSAVCSQVLGVGAAPQLGSPCWVIQRFWEENYSVAVIRRCFKSILLSENASIGAFLSILPRLVWVFRFSLRFGDQNCIWSIWSVGDSDMLLICGVINTLVRCCSVFCFFSLVLIMSNIWFAFDICWTLSWYCDETTTWKSSFWVIGPVSVFVNVKSHGLVHHLIPLVSSTSSAVLLADVLIYILKMPIVHPLIVVFNFSVIFFSPSSSIFPQGELTSIMAFTYFSLMTLIGNTFPF